MSSPDLDALMALQADAAELERLEDLLDRFNAFEATPGFDKNEEMHSNFLASLLDPRRTGALGERLIRELLRETLDAGRETVPPTSFGGLGRVLDSLDGMDLRNTLVRREHYHVDVLLTNEDHRLAVIVENKIWASEGPGQLDWYDRIIRHTHPGWDVHRVFLSPSGFKPTHPAYVPLSYGTLCGLLDRVVEDGGPTMDPEVRVPARHYARMVRRRILGDPEAVRLAQDMYQKHKRAFDFVYRHLPNVRAQVKPLVEELIGQSQSRFELEPSSIDTIRFGVKDWDAEALKVAQGWTESKRILMFAVYNRPNNLDLNLFMGPGPEETRRGLFEMAAKHDVFFEPRPNTDGAIRARTWPPIFTRHLLKPEAYETLTDEQREVEIREQWGRFVETDLPRMAEALREEGWI